MHTDSSTPIRVLCVFAELDRGGAETMCMNLYRHIDRQAVQFDFIKHTEHECAYEQEIRELGGRIYTAPKYKVYNHFSYCRWWKEHLKNYPEHKIIHGHYYTIASIYLRIAKQYDRITVGHSHSTDYKGSGLELLFKKIIQRKTEVYSDYRFACSEEAGKWLFPNREFRILKNAIDVGKYRFQEDVREEVREEMGLTEEFVVGTVGRLEAVKNPMGIIDIFKEIHKRNKQAKLLWVGDGTLKGEIQKRLQEEHLEDSVILTGVRSDVDRLMQAMDVFILPSLYEGLPVTAIEAQAAGLPTLCGDSITKEAGPTDLCQFLPLQNISIWTDTVLSARGEKRKNTSADIINAEYDIRRSADRLHQFYLNAMKQ